MKVLTKPIIDALPLLLLFHFLPNSLCQKEFLDQIQEWDYRDGADKVNVQGTKSITRILEKWGNSIFWQIKFSLLSHPDTLLPELSSLRPASEAIDNLLKQVDSIKSRLAELNERLRIIERTPVVIRYKARRSQKFTNLQLQRLLEKRTHAWRRAQRN
ncbi:hypothetical protein E2320_003977 [Naja naja]|uniref:Uncharacterized protein n=1 Tax=Naja naja TaxID=35670 RepID=A0A8C6Y525_NAJNA|nr:hypothetical protein E2320_003977 [Naja naja]